MSDAEFIETVRATARKFAIRWVSKKGIPKDMDDLEEALRWIAPQAEPTAPHSHPRASLLKMITEEAISTLRDPYQGDISLIVRVNESGLSDFRIAHPHEIPSRREQVSPYSPWDNES